MRFLFLTSLAAALAVASPVVRDDHVIHEKRDKLYEWDQHSRAPAYQKLPMRIGLKQQNLDPEVVDRYVMDVSSPSSPNYGKHWSPEKVAAVFSPARETIDAVTSWLVGSGIHDSRLSQSKGNNWIQFDATVEEAERLFATEYHMYKHKRSGGFRIATHQYHIPRSVQEHVDFAMPTIQLDGMRPIKDLQPSLQAGTNLTGLTGIQHCDNITSIDCLRALYNFGPLKDAQPGNELGIAEWADYLYYPDLDPFFANWTANNKVPQGTRPEFISIDGGKMSNLTQAKEGNVIESALDFQTSYSIIYPQGIKQLQLGDGVNVDSVGTFNIFLDALDASYCTYKGGDAPYLDPEYPDPNEGGYTGPLQCGGVTPSHVYSFSYGQIEAALPPNYQQRQCYEWMKLGLQGVSIVFASGDSGVANRYNAGYVNGCVDQDGFYDINGTRFAPSFPVNCPYVTAVGATQLKTKSVKDGEVAVARPNKTEPKLSYYSGGGFSDVFPLPSYQSHAVKSYLKDYPPPYSGKIYNNSGKARGYPDVAAMGVNLPTVYLNRTIGVGGTSASAPIVASLITLLNEERLKCGKGPVGFINPLFYAHPEAFNDITEGGNPGCGTQGFNASKGWDPVTGLGTPKFDVWLKKFV